MFRLLIVFGIAIFLLAPSSFSVQEGNQVVGGQTWNWLLDRCTGYVSGPNVVQFCSGSPSCRSKKGVWPGPSLCWNCNSIATGAPFNCTTTPAGPPVGGFCGGPHTLQAFHQSCR